MFNYWQKYLSHASVSDPEITDLHLTTGSEFCPALLIYLDEVEKHNPKSKCSSGFDGLTVKDT